MRVEHVESSGVGDAAEVGAVLSVRAFVSPRRPDPRRRPRPGRCTARPTARTGWSTSTVSDLALAETYEGGRYRFDGDVVLDHSGPFGYTVRVIPRNELLTSVAELGVVALAGSADPSA